MRCPKCNCHTSVTDSRYRRELKIYYRRRECDMCHYRFTTYETYANKDIVVEAPKPKAFIKRRV